MTVQAQPRTPLGRKASTDLAKTVLRIVGRQAKTPAVDVAAFQSFAN